MDELKERAARGLSWTALGLMVRQPLNFVSRLVMARLLSPGEFGQFAMVWVLLEFGKIFTELGLGAAIVQKTAIEERHRSTAFWLIAALSGLVLAAVSFAAPAVARFYGSPEIENLIRFAAVVFPISGLAVVHQALLSRALEFRRLALVEVTATVVAAASGITGAAVGLGVWSLVLQALVLGGLTTALSWLACRWRPRFIFDRKALAELKSFSSNLVGHRLLDFVVMNVDDVLIGKFIGPAALGFYTKAYWIMLFPLRQVSEVVTRVMYPALSSIQKEHRRLRTMYLSAISSIAAVTFPAMLGLLVTADSFVSVVLGPQWSPVVPILRVFCIVGLLHSLGTTLGWLYLSQGRADLMFRWSIVAGIFKVTGIVVGLQWGAVGVACGYTAGALLLLYPGYVRAGKLIGMTFGDVARAVGPVLGCSLGMALVVYAVRAATLDLAPAWQLGLQVAAGVGTYLAVVRSLKIEAYLRLERLVARYRRSARRAPGTTVNA